MGGQEDVHVLEGHAPEDRHRTGAARRSGHRDTGRADIGSGPPWHGRDEGDHEGVPRPRKRADRPDVLAHPPRGAGPVRPRRHGQPRQTRVQRRHRGGRLHRGPEDDGSQDGGGPRGVRARQAGADTVVRFRGSRSALFTDIAGLGIGAYSLSEGDSLESKYLEIIKESS